MNQKSYSQGLTQKNWNQGHKKGYGSNNTRGTAENKKSIDRLMDKMGISRWWWGAPRRQTSRRNTIIVCTSLCQLWSSAQGLLKIKLTKIMTQVGEVTFRPRPLLSSFRQVIAAGDRASFLLDMQPPEDFPCSSGWPTPTHIWAALIKLSYQ